MQHCFANMTATDVKNLLTLALWMAGQMGGIQRLIYTSDIWCIKIACE